MKKYRQKVTIQSINMISIPSISSIPINPHFQLENSYYPCKSRLSYILILFLNFRSSEPGYSYRLDSYKKKRCVFPGVPKSCLKHDRHMVWYGMVWAAQRSIQGRQYSRLRIRTISPPVLLLTAIPSSGALLCLPSKEFVSICDLA